MARDLIDQQKGSQKFQVNRYQKSSNHLSVVVVGVPSEVSEGADRSKFMKLCHEECSCCTDGARCDVKE
jgi:hypothetical protein